MAQIPTRHQRRAISNRGGPEEFRIGGSGFTVFHWQGHPIGFAQSVGHQSPQPVAAPVPIQPLDSPYPRAIITPAAIGAGTLQVQLYEMFGQKVWDRIMRIVDTANPNARSTNKLPIYNDLREVFVRLANVGNGITCSKIVYPPNYVQKNRKVFYADNYHNCKITDIRDDEQIDIGTMEVIKNMTIMYTHTTRSFANV